MSFLSEIQGKANNSPVAVATPEWGADIDGTVFVRRITALERGEFDGQCFALNATKNPQFSAFVVAHCAVKADGTRWFDDADFAALLQEPGSVVERIYEAADTLNILSVSAREDFKKNYVKTSASSSTPALPASTGSPSENSTSDSGTS